MTSISSVETVIPLSASPSLTSPQKFLPCTPKPIGSTQENEIHSDGKLEQKEVDILLDEFDGDERTKAAETSTYPPISDNESDTRRVEETLRQWEIAERQRRKQERESVTTSSSVFGNIVTRGTSLLLRRESQNLVGRESHVPLGSQENISSNITGDDGSTPTASSSPSPSRITFVESNDPFANPISPFADPNSRDKQLFNPKAQDSRSSWEPPQPLNLPSPGDPSSPVQTPPCPTPSLVLSKPYPEESSLEMRWWHDWLCGCGEGPDRGGDYQAGHTNPSE